MADVVTSQTIVDTTGTKTVMMNFKDICDVVLVELSPEVRKKQKAPEQIAKGLVKYYKKIYKDL